jgi:hypothetical protein
MLLFVPYFLLPAAPEEPVRKQDLVVKPVWYPAPGKLRGLMERVQQQEGVGRDGGAGGGGGAALAEVESMLNKPCKDLHEYGERVSAWIECREGSDGAGRLGLTPGRMGPDDWGRRAVDGRSLSLPFLLCFSSQTCCGSRSFSWSRTSGDTTSQPER